MSRGCWRRKKLEVATGKRGLRFLSFWGLRLAEVLKLEVCNSHKCALLGACEEPRSTLQCLPSAQIASVV